MRNENPENFSFFNQRGLEIWPLEILPYFSSAVIFDLQAKVLRAYNSVGSKSMNLKFLCLTTSLKICRKQISSLHLAAIFDVKNKTKLIFSDFCRILALKYQACCQNILNIYKNTTIMEQIKPNIVNIYLKTAALPPIEASLLLQKVRKSAIFEWLKI